MNAVFQSGPVAALLVACGGTVKTLLQPKGAGFRCVPWTSRWDAATTALVAAATTVAAVLAWRTGTVETVNIVVTAWLATPVVVGCPYRVWRARNDRHAVRWADGCTVTIPVVRRSIGAVTVTASTEDVTVTYTSTGGWLTYQRNGSQRLTGSRSTLEQLASFTR